MSRRAVGAHVIGACGTALVALFWFFVTPAGVDRVPQFLRPMSSVMLMLLIADILAIVAVWKASRWWWLGVGAALATTVFAWIGASV